MLRSATPVILFIITKSIINCVDLKISLIGDLYSIKPIERGVTVLWPYYNDTPILFILYYFNIPVIVTKSIINCVDQRTNVTKYSFYYSQIKVH